MAKTFNELARMLKDLIRDMNNDAHNSRNFSAERYNNLKISMDPSKEAQPHVTINIGISEVTYSLNTLQKMNGSLGPDERYAQRWFNRAGVLDSLKDLWRDAVNKDKKAIDAEDLEGIDELKNKKHDKDKDKKTFGV